MIESGFEFAIGIFIAIVFIALLLLGLGWVITNWNTAIGYVGAIVLLVGGYLAISSIFRKADNWFGKQLEKRKSRLSVLWFGVLTFLGIIVLLLVIALLIAFVFTKH